VGFPIGSIIPEIFLKNLGEEHRPQLEQYWTFSLVLCGCMLGIFLLLTAEW
jgi:hypothetical protein